MTKRTYSPQTKAAVLSALLLGNRSVKQIAKDFDIPRSTVRYWQEHALEMLLNQSEIEELLLKYLREGLRSLTRQTQAFGDREWLEKQNARDLAVLHGILADKTFRLLEALAAGE